MRFNSYAFALFFAALLPSYWLLRKWRPAQNVLLLAAGYYFYACWNPKFLSLLILSTVVDYACGLWLDRVESPRSAGGDPRPEHGAQPGHARLFQVLQFLRREPARFAGSSAGVSIPLRHLEVVLPIGISFYTFQSMSYVIDVYRREIKPTRNLVQFATFVSFFPHLVAGPIMRPTTLLPQVAVAAAVRPATVLRRLVPDLLGPAQEGRRGRQPGDHRQRPVRPLGDARRRPGLLAVYAFAFQIYGDFSGYTDIARGVAKCLGFEIPLNFNLPYFATSPRDFWNRWHISLSTWLRDYLYIPLGEAAAARF